MVVAEVPLWVVHTNDGPGGPAAAGGGRSKTDPASLSAAGIVSANGQNGNNQRYHNKNQAKDSLKLLEGLGGSQKCAIYSIDFHPNGKKFATGGGDGTVKIWNSSSLYPAKKKQSQYKNAKQYESSGESSDGGGGDEDSNKSENDNDEDEGGRTTGAEGSSEESESSSSDEQETVHDLSSVVRKKKDGTSSSPTKATTADDNNDDTPTTSPTKPSATSSKDGAASKQHHQHHHNHRLLCTLSAHTGSSVLSVRFSTNGQYLASAGDDAMVCIYTLDSNSSTQLNGGGNLNNASNLHHHHHHHEHWTRIKICRGHALDVVGLAWAPDDSHLVSCSLDSNAPIIVWKVTDLASSHRPTHSNVLCNPYKILGKSLHTSTVKGVTFDPAGTYLASSGDDPSVCIWRAHDDWGLERRIDAGSGIFRRWKDNDTQALSSQSLFRRLSWSTDGAYICSTNAVIKNKHVASTISREGWAVSNAKTTASGAAILVGHKQPVVASRHCPFLLDARRRKQKGDGDSAADGGGGGGGEEEEESEEDEPEYATLLALGDKRGFVTVWSTKKSRPVFKIQSSESRCMVTDLAWGRLENNDMTLLVSLLDGQVVALRFAVPDELGRVLKPSEQARVFQLRYGIDLGDTTAFGQRRLFVGENSGPKLIENALQYTLEDRAGGDDDDEDDDDDDGNANMGNDDNELASKKMMTSEEIRANQLESRSKGGKKRVQPVFMSVGGGSPKKRKLAPSPEKAQKKKVDTVEGAMELAEKAASGAEAAVTQHTNNKDKGQQQSESSGAGAATAVSGESAAAASSPGQRELAHQQQHHPQNQQHGQMMIVGSHTMPQIPHSTDRIHSVELPTSSSPSSEGNLVSTEANSKIVADCTNSIQVPPGSSGSALPCTIISISRGGQSTWKDHLVGTSCSAISASKNILAVGTADGSVQLYGTSPTNGWICGAAFRSHPPFILGRPIVALQLRDVEPSGEKSTTTEQTELLAVTSDGSFGVYTLIPDLRIRFKGTLMPPMTHMMLATDSSAELHLPKLARIQLTETNRLLLLLSYHSAHHGRIGGGGEGNSTRGSNTKSVGAGGSLQAFVYNEISELWMRVADSRFVLSDFYSTLPTKSKSKKAVSGELSKLDDTVRMGATSSTLRASRRGRAYLGGHADASYGQSRDDLYNDVATRSHCEDRMACALALGSAQEFEFWLSMYIRTIAMSGIESLLRLVVDMILGREKIGAMNDHQDSDYGLCWWLSQAPDILGLSRLKVVQSIVIPEMSKNRALQRITNEIAIEVDAAKTARTSYGNY